MKKQLFYIEELDNNTKKYNKEDILNNFSGNKKQKIDITSIQLNYELNYTVIQLSKILDYYNIPHRKFKKLEKISAIIDFEIDNNNLEIVNKRKKFWFYINELKNDEYFKKLIYVDL